MEYVAYAYHRIYMPPHGAQLLAQQPGVLGIVLCCSLREDIGKLELQARKERSLDGMVRCQG